MAHCYNPSYPGSRDQEDHGWKPVWTNSKLDPISKIPTTKKASGVAQGKGPELKTQYLKKKKLTIHHSTSRMIEKEERKKGGKEGREGGKKGGREKGRMIGRIAGKKEGRKKKRRKEEVVKILRIN
jgi:hypothetical protein